MKEILVAIEYKIIQEVIVKVNSEEEAFIEAEKLGNFKSEFINNKEIRLIRNIE